MKNIKKFSLWITSIILAAISITFISLYVFERQKNNDQQEIIAKNIGHLENNIKIIVDALDDNEDNEITYKNVLALKKDNNLKTLQDLLETKNNDFKLGKQTQYGKMVEEIKGKSKWIKAIYSQGSWWRIESEDYVVKYPDKQLTGEGVEKGILNVGIQGVYLTDSFQFTFTQVEVKG